MSFSWMGLEKKTEQISESFAVQHHLQIQTKTQKCFVDKHIGKESVSFPESLLSALTGKRIIKNTWCTL